MLTDELPIGRFALRSQKVRVGVRLDAVSDDPFRRKYAYSGAQYVSHSDASAALASTPTCPPAPSTRLQRVVAKR